MEFDPGPPPRFAEIFGRLPDLTPIRDAFWFDWGPIFYRGRLDGSARVLCIASDPGPTERVAGRTLVGDAGQRVQGFLRKLGLSRSYLCLNAFPHALFPGRAHDAPSMLALPAFTGWRNELYDAAARQRVRRAGVAGRVGPVDHDHVVAGPGQEASRRRARAPGSDDHHVVVAATGAAA